MDGSSISPTLWLQGTTTQAPFHKATRRMRVFYKVEQIVLKASRSFNLVKKQ